MTIDALRRSFLLLALAGVLSGCASPLHQAPVVDHRHGATLTPGQLPSGVENAGKPGYYTVKPGDTVYHIATENKQTWQDIVAWNKAAAAILTDYDALPPHQRNVLRFMFLDPNVRAAQYDWESVARFVVATFRAATARAGAAAEVEPLIEELCRLSPEFAVMWRDNDVRAHGDGVKRLRHPVLGPITLEYSAFAVDGRPDLSMLVYNPTPDDRDRIKAFLEDLETISPLPNRERGQG